MNYCCVCHSCKDELAKDNDICNSCANEMKLIPDNIRGVAEKSFDIVLDNLDCDMGDIIGLNREFSVEKIAKLIWEMTKCFATLN